MNIFSKKNTIVLIIIGVLAFGLRTYNIATVPPALSWDEVSIGYNAWSILKTGRDEHGVFMPVSAFTAYGDYKPPLSIYLTVPFVAIFGLTETAVRLPSAIAGTVTVLLTYYMVISVSAILVSKHKKGSGSDFSHYGLITSLLLAVSPWHINLSRAGFEANIALLFLIAGVLLLFRTAVKPRVWLVAWLPFVACIYTFNSSRYLTPILALAILLLIRKHLRSAGPWFITGSFIAAVVLLPIVPHLLSPEARLRFAEVNIFSDPEVVETANRRIDESGNTLFAKLVFNRRLGYARQYLIHYLDHFEPLFLFVKGDGNPKFTTRDTGQLYLPDSVLMGIGFLALFSHYPLFAGFFLFWLLSAIIPAGVARETPHALRTLNTLPVWQIFAAYGAVKLGNFGKMAASGNFFRSGLTIIFAGWYLFSVVYYLHSYYTHYPVTYAREWQYGYREAFSYCRTVEDFYDTIYVTDAIGRPYMYAAFYLNADPADFRKSKDSYFDAAGFYHVDGFGKYRFFSSLPAETTGTALIIAVPESVPPGVSIVRTVSYPDGTPALVIYSQGGPV